MNSFSILALSAIFALAEACAGHANAGEFWMDGVSRDSGWYDINKTWSSLDSEGNYNLNGNDVNYCWAAAGSNILSWWQNQLPPSLQNLSEIPTGEKIYNTIRKSAVAQSGGYSVAAWQWFLHGDDIPCFKEKGGAYYTPYLSDDYLTTTGIHSLYFENIWTSRSSESLYSCLYKAMKENHCGITLSVNMGETNHAITLWGGGI